MQDNLEGKKQKMMYTKNQEGTGKSFLRSFRLIFAFFSLYLTVNLFFLRTGFPYHSFYEFLSGAALVSIIWVIIAAFTGILIWLIFSAFERLCIHMGWMLRVEHLFLCTGFILMSGALLWKGKKFIWHNVQTAPELKFAVLISVVSISLFLTWQFRNSAERWLDTLQKRITPLVWLFGILCLLAVPFAAYQIWQEAGTLRQVSAYTTEHRQPLVTFVFDDEDELIYSKVKPVFDAQGEAACLGMVLDHLGGEGHMTAAQILTFQNQGWEIVSHTVTHPDLTTLTGEEIERELRISKERLTALGFNITNFTYPYHTHNATVRNIARKYYRAARAGPEWSTGFNINPHILRKFALSSFEVEHLDNLEALKGLVDDADANHSWLIFTMHNEISKRETVLISLIDYIQAKGIRIVTLNQALDLIGEKESRLGELLFILNNETPLSGGVLRRVHIASQHLLGFLQDRLQ